MVSQPSMERINRLHLGHFLEDDSPFCLSQLQAFDSTGTGLVEHVRDLLQGRIVEDAVEEGFTTYGCNMPICDRSVQETTDRVSGELQRTTQGR